MNKIAFLFVALAIGLLGCSSVADKIISKYDKDIVVWSSDGKKVNIDPGKTTTRNVHVNQHVTRLINSTSADIEFMQGSPSVTITGPENIISKLEIVEKGNTLSVQLSRDVHVIDLSHVKLKISFPMVNELTLQSSGDLTAETIESDMLSINVKGSGDLSISKVSASSFKFFSQGSGDTNIGKVETSNFQVLTQGSGDLTIKIAEAVVSGFTIQGSSDVAINSLQGTQIDAIAQGSGDLLLKNIEVTTFRAIMQGSGDISVAGFATTANLTMQGSGDINARRLKSDRVSKIEQGSGDISL